MRRFRRVLEENPDEPLYLPEICKAIGVSDRTLRRCCQEHLGMGSKRYLLLRRMHLARRALRESSPIEATVAKTATQCGFWHFGRFAGAYQALFGRCHPPRSIAQPGSGRARRAEEVQLPIENKYTAIAAVVGFFLMLWLTDGSLIAAFGVLALIAGIGWAVRRLRH